MKCVIALVSLALFIRVATAGDSTIPVTQLRACATIAHPGERLSCYDRAAADLPAASAAESAAVRAANFGLLIGSQPAPPQARGEPMNSLTAKVVGSERVAKILYVTLDNGQRWRINSRDPLLKEGDEVTIRRAVAGSFTMSVPSARLVKVHRVR
jgi:hypothetical protein